MRKVAAQSPWTRAFREEMALPSGVLGPEDFWALARLAFRRRPGTICNDLNNAPFQFHNNPRFWFDPFRRYMEVLCFVWEEKYCQVVNGDFRGGITQRIQIHRRGAEDAESGRSDFPRSQLFIYFYFCFISDNYGDIQGSRFFDSGWGMVDMGVEGEMSSFFVPRGPAGLRAGGPSTALREEESKNREADGTADLADWAAAKLGFEPDAVQRDLLSAGGRRLIR